MGKLKYLGSMSLRHLKNGFLSRLPHLGAF